MRIIGTSREPPIPFSASAVLLAEGTRFNPDCPLDQKFVIPAQAGIQSIKKFPRSGTASRFCPLRGVFVSLDSRLRGNDGANGLSGFNDETHRLPTGTVMYLAMIEACV